MGTTAIDGCPLLEFHVQQKGVTSGIRLQPVTEVLEPDWKVSMYKHARRL